MQPEEPATSTNLCPICATAAPLVEGVCATCLAQLVLGVQRPDGPGSFGALLAGGQGAPSGGPIQLEDYELLEQIGAGGMGIVYRARQRSLNRIVALKTIRVGQLATPRVIQRFRAEAEAAARLQHPNIVRIYGVGETDGVHHYSMEFVPGRSLAEHLLERMIGPREAAGILSGIARAMAFAHQRGVVHRDLKPSNVLIEEDGAVRVTDFGVAKILEQDSQQTLTGEILGSVSYMAPEQARGERAAMDARSDIYSMGAILYELLCGRPPFTSDQPLEVLRQVIDSEPAAPRTLNPDAPLDLQTICLKCLAKEPSRRYQSAEELHADLQRFLDDEPILARPVSRWERTWRWRRRNRALAGFAAAALLSLIALAAGSSVWAYYLARASQQANEARAAEENLRMEAQASELRARDLNYFANMAAARLAWDRNDLAGLQARLDETADYPGRGFEWHWWRQQLELSEKTFTGHDGPVFCAAFSPDGATLLTGGADGEVKVWDLATGGELRSFQVNSNGVAHLAFAPDGRRVVVTGRGIFVNGVFTRDPIRRVWDVEGRELLAIEKGLAHSDEWEARGGSAVTPDGHVVTVRHTRWDQRQIQVWRIEDGEEVRSREFEIWASRSGGFSPDGRLVMVGSENGQLVIWDSERLEEISSFSIEPEAALGTAAISPDGKEAAFGTFGGVVHVRSIASGAARLRLTGHTGAVRYAAFSPDGRFLATTGEDLAIRLWDNADGRLLHVFKGHLNPVLALAFSPDAKHLASASADGAARLWQTEPDSAAMVLGLQADRFAFARRSDRLLVTGTDRLARVIDLRSGHELARYQHEGWVLPGAISNDGTLVVTASWDRKPRLWEAGAGRELAALIGETSHTRTAAFSADNTRVLTGCDDRYARLWHVPSGKLLLTCGKHDGWVLGVAFSPDGQRFASVDEVGFVRMWDATSGALIYQREGGGSPLAFSPSGRWLVTGTRFAQLQVRAAETGQVVQTLNGHTSRVRDVAFFPDEQRIVTGSRDGTSRVWHLQSGRELLTLDNGGEPVEAVDCRADGHEVVTVTKEGTVRFWKIAPHKFPASDEPGSH